jgi:hypothetical protein
VSFLIAGSNQRRLDGGISALGRAPLSNQRRQSAGVLVKRQRFIHDLIQVIALYVLLQNEITPAGRNLSGGIRGREAGMFNSLRLCALRMV